MKTLITILFLLSACAPALSPSEKERNVALKDCIAIAVSQIEIDNCDKIFNY